MRLLMAVSADGYMARGPEDDMSWTGPMDKLVFRLLTGTCGGTVLCGQASARLMPPLHGRTIVEVVGNTLGREPTHPGRTICALHEAVSIYEDAWLVGGPTLARVCLNRGFVDEVTLCTTYMGLNAGIEDTVGPWLRSRMPMYASADVQPWSVTNRVQFQSDDGPLLVQTWRPVA